MKFIFPIPLHFYLEFGCSASFWMAYIAPGIQFTDISYQFNFISSVNRCSYLLCMVLILLSHFYLISTDMLRISVCLWKRSIRKYSLSTFIFYAYFFSSLFQQLRRFPPYVRACVRWRGWLEKLIGGGVWKKVYLCLIIIVVVIIIMNIYPISRRMVWERNMFLVYQSIQNCLFNKSTFSRSRHSSRKNHCFLIRQRLGKAFYMCEQGRWWSGTIIELR